MIKCEKNSELNYFQKNLKHFFIFGHSKVAGQIVELIKLKLQMFSIRI